MVTSSRRPGRCGGEVVEDPRAEQQVPHRLHLELEQDVLAHRLVGVDRDRPQVLGHLDLVEADLRPVEDPRQALLGRDLAHDRALSPFGRGHAQGQGDRGFAHAALAGDDRPAACRGDRACSPGRRSFHPACRKAPSHVRIVAIKWVFSTAEQRQPDKVQTNGASPGAEEIEMAFTPDDELRPAEESPPRSSLQTRGRHRARAHVGRAGCAVRCLDPASPRLPSRARRRRDRAGARGRDHGRARRASARPRHDRRRPGRRPDHRFRCGRAEAHAGRDPQRGLERRGRRAAPPR